MMKHLDEILENLQDKKWHSFDEISKNILLPVDTLNSVLSFLQQGAFINKKDDKLKITNLGLKFLDLSS